MLPCNSLYLNMLSWNPLFWLLRLVVLVRLKVLHRLWKKGLFVFLNKKFCFLTSRRRHNVLLMHTENQTKRFVEVMFVSLSPLHCRVLHAIPPTEAIDTVEVLPSRTDPTFVTWKGGAVHTLFFAILLFLILGMALK